MEKALILLEVTPQKTDKIYDKLKRMKYVTTAMKTYGRFDIAIIIEVKTTKDIQNFVLSARKISGILSTETLIAVE
ncbi:MAG: Lrp/AsnC ligand binding domain-containing protein [Candidatus Parvarchaeota archaeon]|nr:Lrp/AsnC ligand binding domain-containing protein [Candidatus Parvarchaeota archaeon]MCW1301862.1 Lrp/AsnC ligand binding domain-containing protein [Candidatus Parvarchaeota archaeon]